MRNELANNNDANDFGLVKYNGYTLMWKVNARLSCISITCQHLSDIVRVINEL